MGLKGVWMQTTMIGPCVTTISWATRTVGSIGWVSEKLYKNDYIADVRDAALGQPQRCVCVCVCVFLFCVSVTNLRPASWHCWGPPWQRHQSGAMALLVCVFAEVLGKRPQWLGMSFCGILMPYLPCSARIALVLNREKAIYCITIYSNGHCFKERDVQPGSLI